MVYITISFKAPLAFTQSSLTVQCKKIRFFSFSFLCIYQLLLFFYERYVLAQIFRTLLKREVLDNILLTCYLSLKNE